jgi:hypothetical protein
MLRMSELVGLARQHRQRAEMRIPETFVAIVLLSGPQ